MGVRRTKASLVCEHEALSASEVSSRLLLEPTRSFERGDAVLVSSGVRDHSSWVLESPLSADVGDLDAHLRALLDQIDDRVEDLAVLGALGYSIDWLCSVSGPEFPCRIRLSERTLERLARFPGTLTFDVFVSIATEH